MLDGALPREGWGERSKGLALFDQGVDAITHLRISRISKNRTRAERARTSRCKTNRVSEEIEPRRELNMAVLAAAVGRRRPFADASTVMIAASRQPEKS